MSQLLNVKSDKSLRVNKLVAENIEVYDEATDEYVPLIPGGGGDDIELPPYVKPTVIDFGTDKTKITQSQISLGGISETGLFKTEIKAAGLDVTDDSGRNVKVEGGAVYFKTDVGSPTVTVAYEDIADVVDKVKPVDYLKEDGIEVTSSTLSARSELKDAYFSIYGSTFDNIYRMLLRRDFMMIIENNISKYATYKFDRIDTRQPDQPIKTLMLADIADSQANYLKPANIEMLGSTVYSAINPGGISIGIGLNPTSLSNRTAMATNEFRVTGSPSGNYTSYANGTITKGSGNVLNLEDIINSQKNYLKPERVTFADGSGISQSLLHYVDDDLTLKSKSIKDIANSGGGGLSDLGKFQASNDNSTLTSENIETSLLKMRQITAPVGAINTVAMLSYLYPDRIDFVKDPSNLSPAIWIQQIGNYNGLILDTGGIISQNQLLGHHNAVTPNMLQISDYSLDDDVLIKAKNFTVKHAGSSYVTALNKDIVDVTNKLKTLTSTASQIDAAVASSGGTTYPYLEPNRIEIEADEITLPSFVTKNSAGHSRVHPGHIAVSAGQGLESNVNATRITPTSLRIVGSSGPIHTTLSREQLVYQYGASVYETDVKDIISASNKLKGVGTSTADLNVSRVRFETAGAGPSSSIRFHTSTSGMTYANTIKIPRTPGKYAIRMSGAWGSIGVGNSKEFYFLGSNDFITVDVMTSQNSNSYGRLIVTPIVKAGSISGGDGYFSCKFELHNANSSSNWEIDGTYLMFTNYGLLMDADTWTLT